MDVAEWLRGLGLEQYASAFRDNDVDLEVLRSLTAEDLRELGISSVGHRRRVLNAIAALSGRLPEAEKMPFAAAAGVTPGEAERRQLTVMFCDLVGSTTLSTRYDPEDLREIIGAYHRCVSDTVTRFESFVAKYMGDGVLVYFGYPEAHEDDAERAVRSGLAVINAVARLAVHEPLTVRLGVASGLVVVGDLIGTGPAQERGVVGETPNMAARLQALAEPGTLVIADSTRRLTGNLFGYRDLGKHSLKGFAEAVQLWRVLGPRPSLSQFRTRRAPLLTRIVGRDTEIAILLELWRQLGASSGRIACIAGEAGIGKSRLINEFRHRLARERHLWLEGGGAQSFSNTPFHAITQMIKRALDPAGRASAIELRVRLEHVVDAAGMRVGEVLPAIGEILGFPGSESASAVIMGPGERRDALFEVLIDWLRRAAQRRPVVIVLEDLHWLDPSSLELVGYLIERIETMPVLLLYSMRSGYLSPLPIPAHSVYLKLRRLSDDDLHRIVTKVPRTASSLTDKDIANVIERAEGVPLFAIELARFVGERRAPEIPATLADLFTARLDQLGQPRRVAQMAAVIGDGMPQKVLEEVAGVSPRHFRPQLRTLIKSGVLEGRTYPNAHYAFTHSLLREAVYNTLLRSQRREWHRRTAAVISEKFEEIANARPELLAHHWTNGGELKLGLAEWKRAGDAAAARRAFGEAKQLYENGIAALMGLPPSPERDAEELTIRSLLADVLRITRGFSARETVEATARVRALADRNGDRAQRLLQMWGEWTAASSGGNYLAALKLANQLYSLALADGSPNKPGLCSYDGNDIAVPDRRPGRRGGSFSPRRGIVCGPGISAAPWRDRSDIRQRGDDLLASG
jgi:class 3 adenylate cyclase